MHGGHCFCFASASIDDAKLASLFRKPVVFEPEAFQLLLSAPDK